MAAIYVRRKSTPCIRRGMGDVKVAMYTRGTPYVFRRHVLHVAFFLCQDLNDARTATHCCAQPSCACVDPGPHYTTLHIIKSLEIPLTLPAQWAGLKARTEHSTLYAVYIFCSLCL